MRTIARRIALLGIFTLVVPAVLAESGGIETVPYRLQPGSTFEEGCYGECLCPVLQTELEGTFDLVWLPTGSPLGTYAFEEIDWSVPALNRLITGSGFYTRAGELNELELDLEIDAAPVQHFSSGGFVPAGAEFPDIEITVSINQMLTCFDTVLHLVASPDESSYPTLTMDHADMAWNAVAGASAYDVVCGDLLHLAESGGDFASSTDVCLAEAFPATSTSYDLTPEPGEALWFLVRADDGTYDVGSPFQVGSRDPGINASSLTCP